MRRPHAFLQIKQFLFLFIALLVVVKILRALKTIDVMTSVEHVWANEGVLAHDTFKARVVNVFHLCSVDGKVSRSGARTVEKLVGT